MNIIIYEEINKKNPYKKLNETYSERIKKYCKLSKKNIKKDKIIEKTNKTYFINVRTKTDRSNISSVDFASKLEKITVNGFSNIIFTINSEDSYKDDEISLTNIEPSYDMAIVMLLEQIYRTFKINNNEVYHK